MNGVEWAIAFLDRASAHICWNHCTGWRMDPTDLKASMILLGMAGRLQSDLVEGSTQ